MTCDHREYLDRRLAEVERVWEARAKAEALALEIQAREMARRLDDLNHAHARALEAQSKTVSRETFDIQMAILTKSMVGLVLAMAGILLTVLGMILLR